MYRVVKFLTVVALLVAVSSSAFAQTANQRLEGTTGVGYFNSVAPFGVRHWVNDGMAVDVGVGVDYKNNQVAPSSATTSLFDYAFDVGVPTGPIRPKTLSRSISRLTASIDMPGS